jgi:RNA polymerase sigma factor (TIGR02999 family)
VTVTMNDETCTFSAIKQEDAYAVEQLLPFYDELRNMAAVNLALEKPGQTLQATALVHEAYARLLDVDEAQHRNNRGHFFAAAAEVMRRILVEKARRKQADKHGGGRLRVELREDLAAPEARSDDLVALDKALSRLERHDPDAARLVKLRYFAGLSHQDAAEALGISRRAADRLWALGRAWLFHRLSKWLTAPIIFSKCPDFSDRKMEVIATWSETSHANLGPASERSLLECPGAAFRERASGLPRGGLRRRRGAAHRGGITP